MIKYMKSIIFLNTILFLSACTAIKEPVLPPEVLSSEVHITELSFRGISLVKTIVLSNPNGVAVELTTYDSDLLFEESSYKSVNQDAHRILAPFETVTLTIPYDIDYNTLYQKMSSLENLTEFPYRINTDLQFTLTGEDLLTVSVSCDAVMPLVREPLYRFNSLYVKSLGMMGADIIVRMYALNPNSFDILLKDFKGKLVVNNENWSVLKITESVDLPAGKVGETVFNFRLEFLSMGKTVRDLLSGESELFYDFDGTSELNTAIPLLEEETLVLDLDGEIELYKPESTKEGAHSSEQIEQSIEDNLLHLFGRYSR